MKDWKKCALLSFILLFAFMTYKVTRPTTVPTGAPSVHETAQPAPETGQSATLEAGVKGDESVASVETAQTASNGPIVFEDLHLTPTISRK